MKAKSADRPTLRANAGTERGHIVLAPKHSSATADQSGKRAPLAWNAGKLNRKPGADEWRDIRRELFPPAKVALPRSNGKLVSVSAAAIKGVATSLIDEGRGIGSLMFPSVATIQEENGFSERTVQLALQALVALGWFTRTEQQHKAAAYGYRFILDPVAVVSERRTRKACGMSAREWYQAKPQPWFFSDQGAVIAPRGAVAAPLVSESRGAVAAVDGRSGCAQSYIDPTIKEVREALPFSGAGEELPMRTLFDEFRAAHKSNGREPSEKEMTAWKRFAEQWPDFRPDEGLKDYLWSQASDFRSFAAFIERIPEKIAKFEGRALSGKAVSPGGASRRAPYRKSTRNNVEAA